MMEKVTGSCPTTTLDMLSVPANEEKKRKDNLNEKEKGKGCIHNIDALDRTSNNTTNNNNVLSRLVK